MDELLPIVGNLLTASTSVIQKHNCLQNHAAIPSRPDPPPLSYYRGEPLTHEKAEELCFGVLGQKPWSWKVVCGVNAAYDFFPAQHQIFYRKGKAMWYDPVFKVIKYDGTPVWRRR